MAIDPKHIIKSHGKDHVLYAGLLDEAHRQGLKSIDTMLLQAPTDQNGKLAICRATVETEKGHFSGIGDASPTNVGSMIVQHIVRMAETRAKARALRDALNIDMVAAEELAGTEEDERASTTAAASGRREGTRATAASQTNGAATAGKPACPVHGVALIRSQGRPGHWNGEKDVTGRRPWCDLSEATTQAYEQLLHDWALDGKTVDAKLESSDLRKPWHVMTPEEQLAALPRLRGWAEARVQQAAAAH